MRNLMDDDLKLAGIKQQSLRKLFDQARAQASSIISFTLQWKDLEGHFEAMRSSLLKQGEELHLQQKELVECRAAFEKRQEEIELKQKIAEERLEEVQTKEKDLGLIRKSLQECTLDLDSKENRLSLARKELEDCNVKLSLKRAELGSVQRDIQECNKQFDAKKKQLDMVQRSTRESAWEHESKERALVLVNAKLKDCCKELSVKDEQLRSAQKLLEECCKNLEFKQKEVEKMMNLIAKCNSELELKEQELCKTNNLIRARHRELESKEKQLEALQKLIKDCSGELSVKDEQLRSAQKLLEECCKNLEFKQKEVEKMMNLIAKCNSELELKEQELCKTNNLIRARHRELESKEKQLEALQKLIKDCSGEVDLKCKELSEIQTSIEDSQKELDSKQLGLNGTQKLIEEHLKALGSEEKELSRIQMLIEEKSEHLVLEEKHLDSIKVLIEEYKEELQNKENQHDAPEKLLNMHSAELKVKETFLESIKKSMKKHSIELHEVKEKIDSFQNHRIQCARELEIKGNEFSSLKRTLNRYCKDLELKEREFNVIRMSVENRGEEPKLKESQLKLVQTSIEECSRELKRMKAEQDLVQKSILECSEELKSKQINLDLLIKSLKECHNELDSKNTQLESVQRLQERSENLKMKEKHFEACVKEFESKERRYNSMKKSLEERCKELEVKEKQLKEELHSRTKAQQYKDFSAQPLINFLSASRQSCIEGNGRKLQLLFNELLTLHDFIDHEAFTAMQNSKDPAMLILDAMQGFYPPGLNKGDVQFDLNIVRRSCLILLQIMQKISPEINPKAREEAKKLANEWKAKITGVPENLLQVLGFLGLVAAFKMASAFSSNELQGLLDAVFHHTHTPELQQALGIAGGNMLSSQAIIEQLRDSQVSNPEYSVPNCQSSTTSKEKSLKLVLNEVSVDEDLTQDEISSVLQVSADPAKLVLDVMQAAFSQLWKNVDTGLDASFTRTKVLLLEQLMIVLPKISPQVEEAAKGLAVLWKTKTRLDKENSMEVLAFLLFLAIYQLVSYFRADEIFGLIEIVVQHRQAPQICQALGFADKVPGFIQLLYQRKQFVEAARFSCAFGLAKKFSPELIFKAYLDNARVDARCSINRKNFFESQCQAIDKEVTALKAILEFTAAYKFESRLLIENILVHIANVVKLNTGRENSMQFPAPIVQSHIQGRNYETVGVTGIGDRTASPSIVQWQLHNQMSRNQLQQQGNNKRPRINILDERPHLSQVSAPTDPYFPSVVTPPVYPCMRPPIVQLGSSVEVHGGLDNVGYAGNHFSTAQSSAWESNAGGRQTNT